MRELTLEELELISGGTNTVEEVVVVADGDGGDWGDWGDWGDYGDYGDYGDGGGDGGGDSPPPEPNPTPCVETTFANGVSTHDANRAALAASNDIAAHNDETYEYSSIVYSLNGVVGHTPAYTDNRTDEVNLVGGLSSVPDGAVILGIVHNHPDQSGINDTIPSGSGSNNGEDWDAYDQLQSTSFPRGITIDQNALLWIYSNEDHKTHVYDKTDKNQTTTSCSLQ